MRPLPDITDDAAMIVRGKRSAIAEARREATQKLRDAYTILDGCDWPMLEDSARVCRDYADRLMTIAAMWQKIE